MISFKRKTIYPEVSKDHVEAIAKLVEPEFNSEGWVTVESEGDQLHGVSFMDKAIQEVTLDRFLDGNPKLINSDEDYLVLLTKLREDRAVFIKKEAKAKAKREGVIEDEEA